jgi:hypothetical protein
LPPANKLDLKNWPLEKMQIQTGAWTPPQLSGLPQAKPLPNRELYAIF